MNKSWWKEGIVYQIYPRSFYDSNNDGIGDIQGIIQKLPYIKSLGIDIIWLCPVYQSPNDDNGYDISDYRNIMDEFGTMEDFDELLAEMKGLGLKLVMDLVANHTSDEHQWFLDSRKSKQAEKRDYYIWKDPVDGKEPNNWQSIFGGSAWEYDQVAEQYYLHLFTKKQPDVNWENEAVRREIYEVMKFWLDKGIDGFRMDVISVISKKNYHDSPYPALNDTINKVYANGPKIHEYLQEMNQEVMSKYDMMTVGEGPGINLENGIQYVHEDRNELNMVFHFDHMFIDHGEGGKFDYQPYDFVQFKKVFADWDEKLKDKGWGSIFLGNHDFPRIVSRFANDGKFRVESAKLLAVLLHTLRGTTYIYQGDEIGMTNVAFDKIEDYRDVETFNALKAVRENNGDEADFLKQVHQQGRDNVRTPIQWTSEAHGGFTKGEPWIKVNPNYQEINVAASEKDDNSILNFYRKIIKFRKSNPVMVYGDFEWLVPNHKEIFAYQRWNETESYLIIHNFSDQSTCYELEEEYKILVNNYLDRSSNETISTQLNLRPWESLVLKKN